MTRDSINKTADLWANAQRTCDHEARDAAAREDYGKALELSVRSNALGSCAYALRAVSAYEISLGPRAFTEVAPELVFPLKDQWWQERVELLLRAKREALHGTYSEALRLQVRAAVLDVCRGGLIELLESR